MAKTTRHGYVKAVWFEGRKEFSDVVPRNWISREYKTLKFPTDIPITKAIDKQLVPMDGWHTYRLKHATPTVDTYAEAKGLETEDSTHSDSDSPGGFF